MKAQRERGRLNQGRRSPWKLVVRVTLALGALLLVGVLVVLLFPDTFINGFLRDRLMSSFTQAYPAYVIRIAGVHYNVFENRIAVDSVALNAMDSTFSCDLASLSVRGIGWMNVLREGGVAPRSLINSALDAQHVVLTFGEYMLLCRELQVSMRDSSILVEALEIHPVADDDQFFAQSKFRKTRFRLAIRQVQVRSADLPALLQGNTYRFRSAAVGDLSLDVLLNRDKPFDTKSPNPLMPNESLSLLKGTLQVDSLTIMNGRLRYGERVVVGAEPGGITIDSIKLLAEGITNRGNPGEAINVHMQGYFMNSAPMAIHLSIPTASPDFSFRYSGTVHAMELNRLNSFLEIVEHTRITSGSLQAATFDINVASGHAGGNFRAQYKDLYITVLDKHTGSEAGFGDRVTTILANMVKFRANNLSYKSGDMKIGVVKYTRKPDVPYIQFLWFALRSGIGNTVGF